DGGLLLDGRLVRGGAHRRYPQRGLVARRPPRARQRRGGQAGRRRGAALAAAPPPRARGRARRRHRGQGRACRRARWQNGGVPAADRDPRADRLLAEMQLTDKANVKPLTLSGGLQQRLLIARALMHDPKVLLLDEPTIGLDPQARRLLLETLRRLHEGGLTLIMTTHYMEEADRLCQRLAIIDHGRILQMDTPAALKEALPGGRILDLWV